MPLNQRSGRNFMISHKITNKDNTPEKIVKNVLSHSGRSQPDWLVRKLETLCDIGGYQKPDLLQDSVKLDSNENYVVDKQFQDDILNDTPDVREYPLGGVSRLVQSISDCIGIPASMIGVGNGSDQILDLLLANLASVNTKILTSDPTFRFIEDRCRLYSIPLVKIPFDSDMTLNANKFVAQFENADILYIDSPNNPTGFQFSQNTLESLVSSFDGLVIVDEAYGEFGNYTMTPMVHTHPNLVVVHTLSKSFGLAGLRLGYLVANSRLVDVFTNVLQYPYPLSSITIEAGINALSCTTQVTKSIDIIKNERSRIIKTLREYNSFDVFDSDANFVLFDAHGAYRRIHSALAEQGISIRKLGKVGDGTTTTSHEGCLRVTVGTHEMNSRFLLAVRDLLG